MIPHLPYLPFREGPSDLSAGEFRWRLGVRPLDVADWIEWGPDADAAVAAKEHLNIVHPDTVFAALDGIEPESIEVAEALATHVGRELPEGLHPLDAAARLVPEDLVLMVERPGRGLVFGGGSVCFPNRWDLRSKLGCTMAEVHEPVARLNDQLAGPIDRFLERLQPERSFWRLGWGLLDTDDWFAPPRSGSVSDSARPQPGEMFLRVERETLRRFPATGAVLFTIRTYVAPLDPAVTGSTDRSRLAAWLESMPADVLAYKELSRTVDGIIEHLESR